MINLTNPQKLMFDRWFNEEPNILALRWENELDARCTGKTYLGVYIAYQEVLLHGKYVFIVTEHFHQSSYIIRILENFEQLFGVKVKDKIKYLNKNRQWCLRGYEDVTVIYAKYCYPDDDVLSRLSRGLRISLTD